MKTFPLYRLSIIMVILFSSMSYLIGQTKFTAKNNINISVSGTSTMHDWVMKSTSGQCTATFTEDANGNLSALTGLQFSVSSKALKSGKDGMDKNAYKALKADKAPNITANLQNATITTKDNKTYQIKSTVKLTIAGKTMDTELIAVAKRINDNSYAITGTKNISMKDYGMEPPSFMLGAVKTGNDVVLNFDVVLNR